MWRLDADRSVHSENPALSGRNDDQRPVGLFDGHCAVSAVSAISAISAINKETPSVSLTVAGRVLLYLHQGVLPPWV